MRTGDGEAVLFWVLGPLMVLGATGLLVARSAVHAALGTAGVMIGLGIFYVASSAPFLGVVQVFVYTGAVMMLFLFVLMMVGVDSADSLVETIRGQRAVGLLLGAGLVVLLVAGIGSVTFGGGTAAGSAETALADANAGGNINGLAGLIFGRYVWAFEVTSALLITAAMAAMVLAHRDRVVPAMRQRELVEHRLRHGMRLTPLPPPGVYARHNAVDTPALLPDGTPSELSVSRVLTARGQTRPGPEGSAIEGPPR